MCGHFYGPGIRCRHFPFGTLHLQIRLGQDDKVVLRTLESADGRHNQSNVITARADDCTVHVRPDQVRQGSRGEGACSLVAGRRYTSGDHPTLVEVSGRGVANTEEGTPVVVFDAVHLMIANGMSPTFPRYDNEHLCWQCELPFEEYTLHFFLFEVSRLLLQVHP